MQGNSIYRGIFRLAFLFVFGLLPCGIVCAGGAVKILAYTQYADMTTTGEYNHTLEGINSVGTNYTIDQMTLYSQLDTMLPGHDILLIPEQESASSTILASVGTAWKTTLQNFVSAGGVVIYCDFDGRYQIFTSAGLMAISSSRNINGSSVTVVDSDDPIVQNVISPYLGENGTSCYTTTESDIIVTAVGYGPVIIHKQIGQGHVCLIGHDYYSTNSTQNRIIGNAVFNLSNGNPLKVTAPSPLYSTGPAGGVLSANSFDFTITNSGDSPVYWQAYSNVDWIDCSEPNSLLAPSASTHKTASINPRANLLAPGVYHGSITFTNTTIGKSLDYIIELEIVTPATVPFTDSFETPGTLSSCWSIQGTNSYRTEKTASNAPHSGSSHIVMDSISGAARNELTLTLNMAKRKNAVLRFWAKEFSDDDHSPPGNPFYGHADYDGVAISADGYKWYEVKSLRLLSSAYTLYEVDLDAAALSAGISYNSMFRIRFTQFGYYSVAADGIALDDISVTGTLIDDLQVTPNSQLAISGNEKGPFIPDKTTYTISNKGSSDLSWQVTSSKPWLSIVPSSGTLISGQSFSVEVSLSATAVDFPPGTYTNQIGFTNLNTGETTYLPIILTVNAVPVKMAISDSIDPMDDLQIPFGNVIVGMSRTEKVVLKNLDPTYSLLIQSADVASSLFTEIQETFPTTAFNAALWNSTSGATIDAVGIGELSEPYSLRMNGHPSGGDTVETVVMDLSNCSNLELSYWYERTGGGESPDSGEDLILESWDGKSWTELSRQLGGSTAMTSYMQVKVDLPSSSYHAGFKFRFRNIGTSDSSSIYDDWFIDNIILKSKTPTNDNSLSIPAKRIASNGTSVANIILNPVLSTPTIVAPLGQIELDVTYQPSSIEALQALLVIKSVEAEQPLKTVMLTGNGIPDYVAVSPEITHQFTGHPGGPFYRTYEYYFLTNNGPIPVDWLAAVPTWLNISPESGTIEAGQTVQVRISPNATANSIPEGTYTESIIFQNVTTGKTQNRDVTLNVHLDPKMWYEPDSINVTVSTGSAKSQTLTIGNTGDSNLNYSISSLTVATDTSMQNSSTVYSANNQTVPLKQSMDFSSLDQQGNGPRRLLVRFACNRQEMISVQEKAEILSCVNATVEKQFSIVPGLSLVQLPADVPMEEAISALNQSRDILYAEPDYTWHTMNTTPNDTRWSELWGIKNIQAPVAWDRTTGSGQVIVGVIDTGIDYTHPDLINNMWINTVENTGTAGIDDDGNGFIDDIYGYDFVGSNDSDPMDNNNHGTHCSGTIGGIGNNAQGVAGVNWKVRLMALKFLDSSGSGSTSDAIECIQYATAMGADVLSNSWGGGSFSQALKDAIDAAAAKNILFVAAAGNNGYNNDATANYPSNYDCPNVIAVMATDQSDVRSIWPSGGSSNYGLTTVDIAAPGTDILSSVVGNSYSSFNGTSMATPHVSGAAALLLSANPAATCLELKTALMNNVDKTTALAGQCVSGGRLNVANAMNSMKVAWLTVTPESGSVAPDSSTSVNIQFTPGSLPPGTYYAELTIESNDPQNPKGIIHIAMTVEPEDFFTEWFESSDNDLDNLSLIFKPNTKLEGYQLNLAPAAEFPVDPSGGTVISLRDDDYQEVVLAGTAGIPFYNTQYPSFYIGSNGYITFDTGDTRYMENLTNHFDIPRISALFDDLNPEEGGTISWKSTSDGVAVTYLNIYKYHQSKPNQFQIYMKYDGSLIITYLSLASSDGLAGLSRGTGLSSYYEESDLSSYGDYVFGIADLNRDYSVNLADYNILSSCWQQAPKMACTACNINNDSTIDISDLITFAQHWLE